MYLKGSLAKNISVLNHNNFKTIIVSTYREKDLNFHLGFIASYLKLKD